MSADRVRKFQFADTLSNHSIDRGSTLRRSLFSSVHITAIENVLGGDR
jgi:hypothetical protein